MRNNIIKLLSVIGIFCLPALCSAITITSFGSSTAPTFGIEVTTFTTTQNPSSIDISGSDLGNTLAGSVNSVNIVWDLSEVTLNLVGSASSAPNSLFDIDLFDSSYNFARFTGGNWSVLGSNGVSSLTFDSVNGSFDSTDIIGVQINTAGIGSTITANLSSLQAVPEPSAYAALSGFLALTWVMLRRRRA